MAKPKKRSAGILVFRRRESDVEFFLVHPGGPFWARKDLGAWSIPKGEYEEGEDPLTVAHREFAEETGQLIAGDMIPLEPCTLPSKKIVTAWAVEGDVDAANVTSNLFEMEWPPKSGKMESFPEVDRGEWFTPHEARQRIQPGQLPILQQLCERLGVQSELKTAPTQGPVEDSPQGSLF